MNDTLSKNQVINFIEFCEYPIISRDSEKVLISILSILSDILKIERRFHSKNFTQCKCKNVVW